MPINPRAEEPLRDILGHTIRGDLDKAASASAAVGDDLYREILGLAVLLTGYIAVDVPERYPNDADLRAMAKSAAESKANLPVTDTEIHVYLRRVVFGGESASDVFDDREKVSTIPLFTLAGLLLRFTPKGTRWPGYLDGIEDGIEQAEKVQASARPAIVYLSGKK